MKKILIFSMILLLISVAAFAANASDLAVDLIGTGFDSLDADIAVGENYSSWKQIHHSAF